MKKTLLILLSMLMCFASKAQTEADSVIFIQIDGLNNIEPEQLYDFKPSKLILPTAMIGLGACAIDNNFLVNKKEKIQEKFQDLSGGKTTNIDDYLRWAPVALGAAMSFFVPGKMSDEDRALVKLNSYALMFAMGYGAKHFVNEWRPDGSNNQSFPSGHCANTFMSAELIRIEYGGWYGVGAYTFACGIGFMRMYNNKHWLNDVIAGAGIGILSARLGYWLAPMEKQLLGLDKKQKARDFIAVPYYSYQGNQFGASVAIRF